MVTVVSRAPDVLGFASAQGAVALAENSSADLNSALLQAADALRARGVSRLLVVAGDLPLLCEADLAALARHDCAIAPDRHGIGTNALLWPETPPLEFHFGERSLERHAAIAKAAGFNPHIVRRNGLAHDVDLPEDLIDRS
jgi:2-phospho-L-lactate guanylyltransferase